MAFENGSIGTGPVSTGRHMFFKMKEIKIRRPLNSRIREFDDSTLHTYQGVALAVSESST